MEYSETVPIQYEKGFAEFMGMNIPVDPRVLIPRPETELLVRTVIDLCQSMSDTNVKVLDVGTGSGNIPIGLASGSKDVHIVSVDVSEDAICLARENICKFGFEDRIELVRSDMFGSLGTDFEGCFDVIVSNPPYVSVSDYEKADAWVKAEPRSALLSGEEGMDHLKILIEEGRNFIKAGGFISVEIGYDQAEKVKVLLNDSGYTDVKGIIDFNGYERVFVGRKSG